MIKEPFIKLSKDSVTASNDELWIHSVIKGFETNYKVAEVNINMLRLYTGINNKKKLVTVLNELVKKRKIIIYEDMHCKVPILILNEEIKPNQSLYIFVKECEEKSFILIYYSEIKKIMCSNYSVEKSGLFKQFVSIIDRVNAKPEKYYQIAFPTYDELSQRVGKSPTTLKKYNKHLEAMELTYSKLYMIDKEIKRKVYARYCDKEDVNIAIIAALKSDDRRINTERKLNKIELGYNRKNEVGVVNKNDDVSEINTALSEVMEKELLKYNCEINETSIKFVTRATEKYGELAVRRLISNKIFKTGSYGLKNPTGILVNGLKDEVSLKRIANGIKKEEEEYRRLAETPVNWSDGNSYVEDLREAKKKKAEPDMKARGITDYNEYSKIIQMERLGKNKRNEIMQNEIMQNEEPDKELNKCLKEIGFI